MLWLIAAPAGTVSAQDTSVDPARDRRARQHFESGSAYFEIGNYEAALREFRVSYQESPHPEILYNIFLCEERTGNLRAAIEALEAFLASGEVANRGVLEQRLAHLRERGARGETRIDSEDHGDAHPIDPEHASSADAGRIEAPVDPGSSAPSEPPVLAITGFTLAAAGLVTFAVAGGLTLSEDARLETCAPGCPSSEVSTLATAVIVADVGAAVALAGALLGVIGLVIDASSGPPAREARVRLRGLSLEGTF